jgi:hypothetical protein
MPEQIICATSSQPQPEGAMSSLCLDLRDEAEMSAVRRLVTRRRLRVEADAKISEIPCGLAITTPKHGRPASRGKNDVRPSFSQLSQYPPMMAANSHLPIARR